MYAWVESVTHQGTAHPCVLCVGGVCDIKVRLTRMISSYIRHSGGPRSQERIRHYSSIYKHDIVSSGLKLLNGYCFATGERDASAAG